MSRYQRIFSQIWWDEKFRKLSEEGQRLFLYILTSPHSNILGSYVLPREYICADLRWTRRKLAKPFAEVLEAGLIAYDEAVNLIVITNHLKHNPLENENQTKAALKVLDSLPKSPILSRIKPLGKPFLKPLAERLGKPETEEEKETEAEKEKGGLKLASSSLNLKKRRTAKSLPAAKSSEFKEGGVIESW